MLTSDYIIVGGGLSGTALAVRLSEDPSVTVTIIEAGGDTFHDETIDTPAKSGKNLGDPTKDWMFFSSPQKHLDGRSLYLSRGKRLGGSSLLNFMFYNRATSVEYNAIEELGGLGWSWDKLVPYFRKSETFSYKEEDGAKYGMEPDKHYQGISGPVQRTIPRSVDGMALPWIEAFKACGISYNKDPNNGDNTGVWLSTNTINAQSVRSSSASAYYEPNRSRSNLSVIVNAHATRIITSQSEDGLIAANGVEFLKDGKYQIIEAHREVILSCGAYKTPQILELSGIGDPQVLRQYDIPIVVDLPGVGQNLQVRRNDHISVLFVAKLKPGHETYENMEDPLFALKQEELYKATGEGMLVSGIPSAAAFLPFEYFDDNGEISRSVDTIPLDNITNKVQRDWVKDKRVPFLECILIDRFPPGIKGLEPGANYLTTALALLHPFNRGSVHITTKDQTAPPEIDVNYLDNEADLKILVKGIRVFREICSAKPLNDHIESETFPGKPLESDDDIIAYLRREAITTWHPIGTASMLPREHGGCVDNELKVYGTKNLRVVDASVLPVQISAHLQATLYAFAEKAADIIKASANKY